MLNCYPKIFTEEEEEEEEEGAGTSKTTVSVLRAEKLYALRKLVSSQEAQAMEYHIKVYMGLQWYKRRTQHSGE